MKMITRETILTILTEPNVGQVITLITCHGVLDGIKIINEYCSPRVVCNEGQWKTVAVDTMLAFNFSEESCEKLSKLGWYIEAEYLVIDL